MRTATTNPFAPSRIRPFSYLMLPLIPPSCLQEVLFKTMDADGSGKIDEKECGAFIQFLMKGCTDDEEVAACEVLIAQIGAIGVWANEKYGAERDPMYMTLEDWQGFAEDGAPGAEEPSPEQAEKLEEIITSMGENAEMCSDILKRIKAGEDIDAIFASFEEGDDEGGSEGGDDIPSRAET